MLGSEFDPNFYRNHGELRFTVFSRYITGLVSSTSQGLSVYANEVINLYNPNWLGFGEKIVERIIKSLAEE